MSKRIQIAYKCKVCSEFIVGKYHEMVSCSCDKIAIDVGTIHDRIHGDLTWAKENWEDYSIYDDTPIEEYCNKFLWGSYGIDEIGTSLLDIWAEKQPQVVKDYFNIPNRNIFGPKIDEVLSKKEYKKYNDWLDSKPKKEYMIMKDMNSNHILEILKGQKLNNTIKEAFKLEITNRGIDVHDM